ncbi:MAG: HAD family phosphatase [Pseudomonadota bacterium]
MAIRNIVFDVGNVIVPWDPVGIEQRAFGEERVASNRYTSPFRGNQIWLAINRGEISLDDARARYVANHDFTPNEIERLYVELMASFPLKIDTLVLMNELKVAGFRLFAITDNVREIVAHLKEAHDFWHLFDHAAVSAEIGVLKPDARIYRWLLNTAGLSAAECVFLDDVQRNVDGAKAVGMAAQLFTDAAQARRDLRSVGVDVAEVA